MLLLISKGWAKTRDGAVEFFKNPACLAFVPAVCLGLFWFGGEMALMISAVAVPLIYMLSGNRKHATLLRNSTAGLLSRDGMLVHAEHTFERTKESGLQSAVFQIEIDEFGELTDQFSQASAQKVVDALADRIVSVMRKDDAVAQTGPCKISVCVAPVAQLDLELCIQIAARLQATIEDPVALDGTALYVTACIGFCQRGRLSSGSGKDWLNAASSALREAQHSGNNSIRAYSHEMRHKAQTRGELRAAVITGLERGQIQPWYQPQISTDTGLVTGFEALARWDHPNRGMVSPAEFLPAVEEAGKLERLAEVMIYHAFTALKAWDSAGVQVPCVGVNFAGPELSNPKLVDKIKWELDRFDLAPERLVVEVLETVVAGALDDTITRNINGLSSLGCRIDLVDFGTGHASISSIRRFSVSRIKIDRSFVMKADRDPDQQRMVSAILTMAERLGVETLAEGVETVGEHALLAQLGCNHVQGFGIGKPMPFDQTLDWITRHNAKLQAAPQILGNRSG